MPKVPDRKAYSELIYRDIVWLHEALEHWQNQYPVPEYGKAEAEHIERVLRWSIKALYDEELVLKYRDEQD